MGLQGEDPVGPKSAPSLRELPLRFLLGPPTPDRSERDRIMEVLTSRYPKYLPLRYVTVTQIVDPRQAYWEIMAPDVEIPLVQVERMEAGSVFHDRFAHVVTSEPFREQRVDKDEVRGKIDIYEEHPVEVKTTGSLPDDIVRERPTYLLQLLFYCAMVDKPRGEIVVVSRSSPDLRGFDQIRAYRVEVSDLKGVWEEALRRRDALRAALERHDPSALPGCPWFGKTCTYSGRCNCTAGSTPDDLGILSFARVEHDPQEEARLKVLLTTNGEAAWKKESLPDIGPPPLKLRDLPMLRRKFIERLLESEEDEAEISSPAPTTLERVGASQSGEAKLQEISGSSSFSGMRKRVLRALGTSYAHARRGPLDDPWVANVDGMPVRFKMTKLRNPVDRTEIIRMFPDEVAELGAAAGLLGAKSSLLVLYYERVADERQKLLVYEIPVRDPPAFLAALDEIGEAWETAWKTKDSSLLPKCPAWAVERCPLADRCGCRDN